MAPAFAVVAISVAFPVPAVVATPVASPAVGGETVTFQATVPAAAATTTPASP